MYLYHRSFISYLEREKKIVGEATVFEYRWGSRAKVEVDKRELLTIMSEVGGVIMLLIITTVYKLQSNDISYNNYRVMVQNESLCTNETFNVCFIHDING